MSRCLSQRVVLAAQASAGSLRRATAAQQMLARHALPIQGCRRSWAGTPAAAYPQRVRWHQQCRSLATGTQHQQPSWEIKMLYDGKCPLCMREVNMLQKRNEQGKIAFVDIASPDYDKEENAGITFQQGMEAIHAVLPDGRVITNIEVFRRLYEAVGLGWVYYLTRYEPIRRAANAVYGVWARWRMEITGRGSMQSALQQHQEQSCRLPQDAEKQ